MRTHMLVRGCADVCERPTPDSIGIVQLVSPSAELASNISQLRPSTWMGLLRALVTRTLSREEWQRGVAQGVSAATGEAAASGAG